MDNSKSQNQNCCSTTKTVIETCCIQPTNDSLCCDTSQNKDNESVKATCC